VSIPGDLRWSPLHESVFQRPPRPPRLWPVFVTFVVMLPAVAVVGMFVLLAMMGVGGLLEALRGDTSTLSSTRLLMATTAATELVMIGAVLVAARPFNRARLRLERGRASSRVMIAAALGCVALSHILDTAIALLSLSNVGVLGKLSQVMRDASGGSLALVLLVVSLLAGVAEELFFRGFMQTRLSQRWRPWTAILVSALFFGIMHLDFVQSPLALCLGIWLGFVCERSGSLWPAIVAHVANNAVATLLARIAISFSVAGIVAEVSVALVVFLGCAFWLVRALPAGAPPPPETPPPSSSLPEASS
jgi:membrane protease YdiL (CAAX protease family)